MPDTKQIRIKPTIAILCDDVRQENNGKPFIIGIYTGGIALQEPSNVFSSTGARPVLPLAVWLIYEASEAGKADLEFQIIAPNPERKILINAAVELRVKPPPHEILTLSFGGLMVPIEHPGDIKLMFKHQEDTEWQTLRTVPVTFSNVDSPIRSIRFSANVTERPS